VSATAKSRSRETNERYRLRGVERALDLLEALAEADSDGLRLSELARRLDTSKSTVLAVLRTLTARGFVAELGEGRSRRYRLGLTLARLGDEALGQLDLLEVALPTLRAMTDETGWTSRIGVLDEAFAVIIGRVDGPGIIRFQSNLAQRELPHCSAIGKALLAQLPEERVRAIIARTGLPARTPSTITDLEQLLRELETVRLMGFAVDDEEDSESVCCVGAALFDHRRACVGAISVTGLKLMVPDGGVDRLGGTVSRHAAAISASLGAVPAAADRSCAPPTAD
jgi:IclR family acetate operon transcriptional repressor